MHHIGISSGIISNHLQILTYKIENNITLSNDDLKRSISTLNLENQKILSISRFATKANFKLKAENQRLDLVEFIVQYINNIALTYLTDITIDFNVQSKIQFVTTFKPIELTMIIDNLISNSKKAKATKIKIDIEKEKQSLKVYFKDNGIGIPKSDDSKIFNFGYTTTGGSGLGLTHVKETLEKIDARIQLLDNIDNLTIFLLTFK
jgi:signal transduction histidine kinase